MSETVNLPGDTDMQQKSASTSVLITVVVSAVFLVGMVVILSALGKDTSDALQLIGMIVPVVIIQVLQSAKIEKIEQQTNGNLTARLHVVQENIKNHIDSKPTPLPEDTGTPGVNVE